MMKLALLTNFIPPYRVSLFRALAQHCQLRVFVSTKMERNRTWKDVSWDGLDVVVQRGPSLQRTWKTDDFEEPYQLHLPYDTIPQLAKWQPNVVITGELGARSLQALAYGRWARIPVVLWATLSDRTEAARDAVRNAIRRLIIPRFDAVIVNGEAGARYIRRFREDEPTRVPYTTDMTPFLALPLEGRERRLLYVGARTARKGFPLLEDARRRLGIEVTVLDGRVPYDELPGWYERAGFLIFPTLADEWGVVVNEALAAGVPVIGSTYSQAVEELIVDGSNGWRFTPDSADAVANALEKALATNDDDLLLMRKRARESVSGLTPENAAAKIAALVKDL